MRWKSALNGKWLLVYFLMAASTFAGARLITPAAAPQAGVEGFIQLGFYDLMSRRKEIYDSHMQTVNHATLTTITNPNDNRFVLKGKFSEINERLC